MARIGPEVLLDLVEAFSVRALRRQQLAGDPCDQVLEWVLATASPGSGDL
jgi:hypothetical protein